MSRESASASKGKEEIKEAPKEDPNNAPKEDSKNAPKEGPKHPVMGEDAVLHPEKVPALRPGYARPVMIHRAIYGSFERFIGILIEHFAARFPFWLSPRQILIIPVMPAVNDYCKEVQSQLREEGFHADVDLGANTMMKKIRTGQLALYNFIFVVGAEERDSKTVNIRNRDDQSTQQRGEVIPLQEAIEKLTKLRDERRLENKI
jgi:threonyl-tRNA synthetase